MAITRVLMLVGFVVAINFAMGFLVAQSGCEFLDAVPRYTPETAVAVLSQPCARSTELVTVRILDILYPLMLAALAASVLATVGVSRRLQLVAVLPALFADYAENVFSAALLALLAFSPPLSLDGGGGGGEGAAVLPPGVVRTVALAASWATRLKFLLYTLPIWSVLLSLLFCSCGILRRRICGQAPSTSKSKKQKHK